MALRRGQEGNKRGGKEVGGKDPLRKTSRDKWGIKPGGGEPGGGGGGRDRRKVKGWGEKGRAEGLVGLRII